MGEREPMDEHLQGRIIALELFMRSELVAVSMAQKNPIRHLEALKTALLADFQTFGPSMNTARAC